MEEELKDTVSLYVAKYGKTLEQKLGMTKDDLMNEIRIEIWKGLLTHKPGGKANIKTYINTIIKNRFGVLFKRSKIKKNNMVYYYGDVFEQAPVDEEHTLTEDTSETIFSRRQIILQDQRRLQGMDRRIYEDLLLGRNLSEIEALHKISRIEATAAINRINEMVSRSKSRR